MPEIYREAARLLVLSPAGRVLLLRIEPSFRPPFWATSGGGLDDLETVEQAAHRELREEVGRDDLALGPLLWVRNVEFTWEEWHVRQKEHTFLVEAKEEFEAVVVHPDEEPIVGSRWFDVHEQNALDETFYPEDLAELLTKLKSDGPRFGNRHTVTVSSMPSIVIVSGAPGAGKSTLAEPLAARLGFPLLSKDQIKELLYDVLGPQESDARAWSRQLGSAAMELLWSLAGRFPAAVLEANFRPHSDYERSRLLALGERVVEVHCDCPIELAAARYSRRARSDHHHHPVHVVHDLGADLLTEFDGPMALGPVIEVDTTKPVDVAGVADEVIALLGADT